MRSILAVKNVQVELLKHVNPKRVPVSRHRVSVMFTCTGKYAKIVCRVKLRLRQNYGQSKQCMLFRKEMADPLCVQPEMNILKEKKKPNPDDFFKVRLETQEEGDASPLEYIKQKNEDGFERLEAELNRERGISEFETTKQHESVENEKAEQTDSEKGLVEKVLDGLRKVEEVIEENDTTNPNKRLFDHPVYTKQAIMPPLTPEQEEVVRFGAATSTHFTEEHKRTDEKKASGDETNAK